MILLKALKAGPSLRKCFFSSCYTKRGIINPIISGEDDDFAFLKIPLIEVTNDGVSIQKSLHLEDLVDDLRNEGKREKTLMLPMRDLRMFFRSGTLHSNKLNKRVSFSLNKSYRQDSGLPAILPRPKAGCYLLDLGLVKLLCKKDRVLVLDNHDQYSASFVSDLKRNVTSDSCIEERATWAPHSTAHLEVARYLSRLMSDKTQPAPFFELLVLETAFSTVTTKFHRHLMLIEPVLDVLLCETSADPSDAMVGRLTAFKKSMYDFAQTVTSVRNTVKELLTTDSDMADLYLTESRLAHDHEEVELLLEAYTADLVEIELEVSAMMAQIEDTMELINTHLNGQRNRIIRLSLVMDMCALTACCGAMVGSAFGMNLTSGVENHPLAFYYVTFGTCAAMVGVLTVLSIRFKRQLNSAPPGVSQYRAMKHFFKYVDQLEARMVTLNKRHFTRDECRQLLKSVSGGHVHEEEVDLMFRVFDGNRNNRIEAKEMDALMTAQPKKRKRFFTT